MPADVDAETGSRLSDKPAAAEPNKAFFLVASLAAILLPCIPLFDLHCDFAGDWVNQLWFLNYSAVFFKHHHYFTPVRNTIEIVGIPSPVFYGYLLTPTVALFSTRFDAGLPLRIFFIVLFASQFVLFFKLIKSETHDTWLSYCIAVCTCWSIYPLTNLYNRGALPEFIATSLLTCAVALIIFMVKSRNWPQRLLYANLATVMVAFAAGCHPITAFYGTLAVGATSALAMFSSNIKNSRHCLLAKIIPSLLATICLFPWAYAASHGQTQVRATISSPISFTRTVDSLAGRLMPLPPTYTDEAMKADNNVTLFVDAPINWSMFLILVAMFFSDRKDPATNPRVRITALICISIAVLLIALSLMPGALTALPTVFRIVQFPYRLVYYANLFLLVGASLHLVFGLRSRAKQISRALLVVALLTAMIPAILKIQRAQQVSIPNPAACRARTWEDSLRLLTFPNTLNYWDYSWAKKGSVTHSRSEIDNSANARFIPGMNERFGLIEPVTLADSSNGLIRTNILYTQWCKITDGKSDLERSKYNGKLMGLTLVEKHADSGVVNYEFAPPETWTIANAIAIPLFECWLFLSLASSGLLLLPSILNRSELVAQASERVI